jgi:multidrug resistance efflux pump
VVLAVLVGLGVVGYRLWFVPSTFEVVLHGVVEVQEVRLGSRVGGRVAEVLVQEGDRVSPGAPLIRLAVPELEAQRAVLQAKLAAAVAERDKAEAGPRDLEKAEARSALAGAEARLARLQKGWREEEIAQARHDLEASEADLRQANRELARLQSLLNTGGSSPGDIDLIRGARDRAQGRTSSARSRLEMLLNGSRPEDIAEAKAERDRLQAAYDLLQEGTRKEDRAFAQAQVEQIRAQIQELEVDLNEATVRAEEACLVEVIGVRRGDLVAPNQPMLRVLRAEDLWVRVYIPEPTLGQVRLGQAVHVSVDAYPGVELTGRITQIASESEFTPRNVQSAEQRKHQVFAAKVRVDDPRGIFKSGLAARVVLPLHGADQ